MPARHAFDWSLLRRYDCPAPRYTSYPTAPHFSSDFDDRALREAARDGNGDPIPRRLALYVHVPFCTSPCFYCGCNRIITRDRTRSGPYLATLYHEIAIAAALFDRDREVIQVHVGGGTPNFLSPAELAEAVQTLRRHFCFTARDTELSIEVDPRTVRPDDIAALAAIGFARASLGIQDFDPAVQQAVNRVQTIDETMAIIDACRRHRFRSVNVDLIYGLPLQTPEGFGRTLDTVIGARPDRLAVYGYAHLPEIFPAQRRISRLHVPGPEAKLELLQLAIEKLEGAGYVYIGMDHFALPDDELALAQSRGRLNRNFMGYTAHTDSDVLGFGVSAISHIGATYSQNPRGLTAWQAAIDDGRLAVFRGLRMTDDDQLRADVIERLMCQAEIPVAALERRYAIDFGAYFRDALARLEPMIDDGLVRIEAGRIAVTSQGRFFLRNIAMCFDAYIDPSAQPGRFSRAL